VIDGVQITAHPTTSKTSERERLLWDAAKKLETQFLAEMLKSAGLNGIEGEFGGGQGSEQYQSFLREAQAEKMVSQGGIGLAESIFESLKNREM
jgi:Rod binding domain-containing protein